MFKPEPNGCLGGSVDFYIPRSKIINSNVPLHRFVKSDRVRWVRKYAYNIWLEEYANFAPNLKNGGPIFSKFSIDINVYSPTRRKLDPPNLWPTVKPIIDAGSQSNPNRPTETGAGIWEDDDWIHLASTAFKYGGICDRKDHFMFKLTIKEVLQINQKPEDIISPEYPVFLEA